MIVLRANTANANANTPVSATPSRMPQPRATTFCFGPARKGMRNHITKQYINRFIRYHLSCRSRE